MTRSNIPLPYRRLARALQRAGVRDFQAYAKASQTLKGHLAAGERSEEALRATLAEYLPGVRENPSDAMWIAGGVGAIALLLWLSRRRSST